MINAVKVVFESTLSVKKNMILIVDRDKPINRTRGIVLVESMVT